MCVTSSVSAVMFHIICLTFFHHQGHDEEDGETDEAWNLMNGALSANETVVGISPQSFFFLIFLKIFYTDFS